MKNLRTLFAVSFLAVLTSCGTTQQAADTSTISTPSTPSTETNRGRSNQNLDRGKTNSSSEISSGKSRTTAAVRNSEELNDARTQQMYSSLRMEKEQIIRYENEWKSSTATWKRSNRDRNMNSFERTEYQDRIMKSILNDSQFQAYQEWARENPIAD